MLSKVDIGWTVIFNDYTGTKCPALVTKVYVPNDSESSLDLHVIGVQNNASFARGKIQILYGVNIIGCWEYTASREIRINENDLPTEGQGLLYNAASDIFETEDLASNSDIDGGLF